MQKTITSNVESSNKIIIIPTTIYSGYGFGSFILRIFRTILDHVRCDSQAILSCSPQVVGILPIEFEQSNLSIGTDW